MFKIFKLFLITYVSVSASFAAASDLTCYNAAFPNQRSFGGDAIYSIPSPEVSQVTGEYIYNWLREALYKKGIHAPAYNFDGSLGRAYHAEIKLSDGTVLAPEGTVSGGFDLRVGTVYDVAGNVSYCYLYFANSIISNVINAGTGQEVVRDLNLLISERPFYSFYPTPRYAPRPTPPAPASVPAVQFRVNPTGGDRCPEPPQPGRCVIGCPCL
ncbi:MAG: hypothetical protein AB7G93_05310 [Bdellovibrionales bacterium]